MKLRRRRGGPGVHRVPAEVRARAGLPDGEKVLAHAVAADGSWLLGTRRMLVIVPAESSPSVEPGREPVRIPWEQVEDAAWDQDEATLHLTEIGEYGAPRPTHDVVMEEPALLLQLVRERVTGSIVLQRRVPVRGSLGLSVIGRRSPVVGPVAWMHAYDAGLDPTDPAVVAVAEAALAGARAEVGDDRPNPI